MNRRHSHDNDRIKAGHNGIDLVRGLDFTVFADSALDPLFVDVFLEADAWAIDSATVAITGNGKIEGAWDDGIAVGGARDGGDFDMPALASVGYGGWSANLLIDGNWTIAGRNNGIALNRGVSGALSVVVEPSEGGDVFVDAGFRLGAVGIQDATVRITGNGEIVGHRDDGVYIRVLESTAYQQPVLGGEPVAPDRTELKINGSALVVGGDNGIAIDHAFLASVEALLSFDGSALAPITAAATPLLSAAQGGLDPSGSGFDPSSFGLEGIDLIDAQLLASAVAIFGTGFSVDNLVVGNELATLPGVTETLAGLGGGFADLGQSVNGGYVVIDLNGQAAYSADRDGTGPAEVGDPYDQEIPLILSDLDFGAPLWWAGDVKGRVVGVHGDGIDFQGVVEHGATVMISPNMITGSGDNGIEFSTISYPVVVEVPDEDLGEDDGGTPTGSLGTELLPGKEEQLTTNDFVHDSFILIRIRRRGAA